MAVEKAHNEKKVNRLSQKTLACPRWTGFFLGIMCYDKLVILVFEALFKESHALSFEIYLRACISDLHFHFFSCSFCRIRSICMYYSH